MKRPVLQLVCVAGVAGAAWWMLRAPRADARQLAQLDPAKRSQLTTSVALHLDAAPKSAIALPTVAAATPGTAKDATPLEALDPAGAAKIQINAVIDTLTDHVKADDYAWMFENTADPHDLARLKQLGQNALEEPMHYKHTPAAIAIITGEMQLIQNQTPTLSDDGNTATYLITDPTGAGRKPLTANLSFRKVDGHWYLSLTGVLIIAADFGFAGNNSIYQQSPTPADSSGAP